jgi:hypothetical protein
MPTTTNGLSAREDVSRIRLQNEEQVPVIVDTAHPPIPTHVPDIRDRPYMLITPVWGDTFSRTFVSVTLPSQLAEGNLGAFAKDEVEYVIVTTAQDEETIRSSEAFRKLQDIAAVSFIRHEPIDEETNYERLTRTMNLALRQIRGEKSVFFLTADDFFADGLLGYARERLMQGSRAVIVPTLRVNQAGFNAHLWSLRASTLKPRELVSAIMQHEHPLVMSVVINCASQTMHELPSQTLVRLKDGYLGRWNVMHPLAVKVAPPVPDIKSTVDWNYPALVSRNARDIVIIRDSDHGLIASPTELGYSQDYSIDQGATPQRRTRNLIEWVNSGWPLNFHTLQASDFVRIHAGDIGPEWRDAEIALDEICGPYLEYVRKRALVFPDSLRGSNGELLSPAVRSSELSVRLRRAFRLGLKKGRAKLKGYIRGALTRLRIG